MPFVPPPSNAMLEHDKGGEKPCLCHVRSEVSKFVSSKPFLEPTLIVEFGLNRQCISFAACIAKNDTKSIYGMFQVSTVGIVLFALVSKKPWAFYAENCPCPDQFHGRFHVP